MSSNDTFVLYCIGLTRIVKEEEWVVKESMSI